MNILYEEGEGADESLTANLSLTLSACPGGGVIDGAVLTVEDFSQNLSVSTVCICIYVYMYTMSHIVQ